MFIWVGKLFYGLLYKELFLVNDRKSKSKASITNKELLKAFSLHHLFLQAARLPFEFVPAIPASIFVFRIDQPRDVKLRWDFRDSLPLMTMSVRIGSVGFLAALQDGGAQRDVRPVRLERYQKFRLHPLHFNELTAAFFYCASLLDRVPKFITIEPPTASQPVRVIQNPLQGASAKPIFKEWKQEEFAKVLSHLIGLPMNQIFFPPTSVMTWLHDGKGRIRLHKVVEVENSERLDVSAT